MHCSTQRDSTGSAPGRQWTSTDTHTYTVLGAVHCCSKLNMCCCNLNLTPTHAGSTIVVSISCMKRALLAPVLGSDVPATVTERIVASDHCELRVQPNVTQLDLNDH